MNPALKPGVEMIAITATTTTTIVKTARRGVETNQVAASAAHLHAASKRFIRLTCSRTGTPSRFPEILCSSGRLRARRLYRGRGLGRRPAERAGAGHMKLPLSGPSNTMTLRSASLRFTLSIASLISSSRYWREMSSSSFSLPAW